MCVALFEQRHEIVKPAIAPVDGADRDFARALALHHIIAPTMVGDSGSISTADGDETRNARLLADALACIATRSFEERLKLLRSLMSLTRTIGQAVGQVAENHARLELGLKSTQDFLATLPPQHPERPAAEREVAQSGDRFQRYSQAVHPPMRTAIGAIAIMTWKLEGTR
jgi:hypothetical protein